MQLDKLIIETRVRSGWSSIDLGFILARRFWLRSVLLYLILAVPIYCSVMLLVTSADGLLAIFIIWWLKPFYERRILHMMSRELFSQPMPVFKVIKEFGLWMKPSFFWVLFWRRLSIFRGMSGPIMLLEQPNSSAYSKRASVLVSKFSNHALWLNVILFHIESFFYLASLGMLAFFFPEAAEALFSDTNSESMFTFLTDGLYLLAMATIAPFFTVAGFMLYISRRIELEGWDTEIVFRNWMSNYRAPILDADLEKAAHSQSQNLESKT